MGFYAVGDGHIRAIDPRQAGSKGTLSLGEFICAEQKYDPYQEGYDATLHGSAPRPGQTTGRRHWFLHCLRFNASILIYKRQSTIKVMPDLPINGTSTRHLQDKPLSYR